MHNLILSTEPAPTAAMPSPPTNRRLLPRTFIPSYPDILTTIRLAFAGVVNYWTCYRNTGMEDGVHEKPDELDWQALRTLSLQPHGFGEERVRIW